MIWFIGGGCYHADMITLGALKILKKADCILYDPDNFFSVHPV